MGDILVVNAGSTSLRLHLVAEDETRGVVGWLGEVSPYGLDAVAHRLVHGGPRFREPVVIDEAVCAEILALGLAVGAGRCGRRRLFDGGRQRLATLRLPRGARPPREVRPCARKMSQWLRGTTGARRRAH
jgi:hypothetical protein